MDAIVPRWEWRTFGRQFDLASLLVAYRHVRQVVSTEWYLVSPQSRDNAKIRDDKMDIKRLQNTLSNGLEQWMPLMKAEFPLSRKQVGAVYEVLALPAPPLAQPAYDMSALLDVVRADRRAATVHVYKVRDQYDADGCVLEMADVEFDGDRYQTVAVEHADPEKVARAVTRFGFALAENVNFIRFMQQLKSMHAGETAIAPQRNPSC